MKKRVVAFFALLACSVSGAAQPAVVKYYHLDGIGNVRAVSDAAGKVIEQHEYVPFGEEWNPQPSGDARKFTGKERDPETGFDYFGARYYGSEMGRFTSVDPVYTRRENLVDPQRWNRYTYVRNNPLRFTDPDGRVIETPWDALNVGLDVVSLASNIASGNIGGAALDAAGLVYDVVATAVPGLPGAAGTAIKAARAADKVLDVAKAGDRLAGASKLAEARDLLKANKVRGDAFRDEIAELMRKEGYDVQTEVSKNTPFGRRVIDVEVSKEGKVLGGMETKTGASRYTPAQRSKDEYLQRTGYPVNVARDR